MVRSIAFVLTTFLVASAAAQPLSWSLTGDPSSWPAGQQATITHSMDEGVDVYNQLGFFDKHVTAVYNAGVPTAQSNYDGYIEFGGANNARVAIHELAHALGIGTYWQFNNGTWSVDSAAGRLEKVYDGQGAVLSTGGSHFWPYGLNYDSEDGSGARERHCRLVAAFRWDMGIVQDSDHDGMPDDWETFHFAGLTQDANGDPDADGIANLDEYNSDGDPMKACPVRDGARFQVRAQISGRLLALNGAAKDGTQLQLHSLSDQHWTARYVGQGYWKLVTDDGWVLEVPGTDTTSGLPLQLAKSNDAMQQQWRVVSGPGAQAGYWVIANRETGRVVDGLDGKENTSVQQYPFLGDIPQQFWSFEADVVASDAGALPVSDAGTSFRDAGAGGNASVDASPLPALDASRADATSSLDSSSDATLGPGAEPAHHEGCALAAARPDVTQTSWTRTLFGLLAAFTVLRRRRAAARR